MKKKILTLGLVSAMICGLLACTKTKDTAASEVAPASVVPEVVSEVESIPEIIEATVSESSETPDFSGTWAEEIAGRGTINFVKVDENVYDVDIHWASSAFEGSNWTMTATYYDSTGLCEYSDATYYIRTYTDDENYTDDVKYEGDGAGYFWIENDGRLCWQSDNSDVDGIDGSSFFINADAE